jgi:hypothetical protein
VYLGIDVRGEPTALLLVNVVVVSEPTCGCGCGCGCCCCCCVVLVDDVTTDGDDRDEDRGRPLLTAPDVNGTDADLDDDIAVEGDASIE